jgi:hypothetical protein
MRRRTWRRNIWSPEADVQLGTMRAKGYGFEAIGLAVGHSPDQCKARAGILGIYKGETDKAPVIHRETYSSPASEAKTKTKKRIPCMNDRCKKMFYSDGPHHRLCQNCRHQSLSAFDTPAQVLR